MGGSLNQPCRVREEGPTGRKPLLPGKNKAPAGVDAGTGRIRTG